MHSTVETPFFIVSYLPYVSFFSPVSTAPKVQAETKMTKNKKKKLKKKMKRQQELLEKQQQQLDIIDKRRSGIDFDVSAL